MPKNDIIFSRLRDATQEERKQICKDLKIDKKYTNDINKISKEYRAAGGHTIANVFRDDHDLPYKQILVDVADKLKPGFGWTDYSVEDNYSEIDIEEQIEKYVLERIKKKWESLSKEERIKKEKEIEEELKKHGYDDNIKKGIFTIFTYGGAAAGVTPLAMSIFYSSFFSSIYASIFGVSMTSLAISGAALSVAAAPIALLVAGTPAYRKTIPATITMIRIRKRIEYEQKL